MKDTVTGFGGGVVPVLYLEAEFIIDDDRGKKPIIYSDLVGFTERAFPQTHPQQTAIFGTVCLFRKVAVTFNYPNNIHIEKLK